MSSSRSPIVKGRLEPSRIELARLASGITKAELARALGVTPRTITNYETGGAPEDLAADLAKVLGCQPDFFWLPPVEPLEHDRVFFRALRRSSASQRHAATAAGRLGIELYEWIGRQFVLPGLDLPDFEGASPEAAAAIVRAAWGLGDRPLPNLVQLAESRGIRVLGLPVTAEAVDAFSVWSDGTPYVFMCRAKTPERARFDLAHELGHLLLHSRSGRLDECVGADVEREADRFASELLIPADSLSRCVRLNPSLDEILTARSYFGVSAMALTYRLHAIGHVSDYAYRQHCVRLSAMGFRSGEPGGMLEHELSRIFTVVLRRLRTDQKLTTEDIARQLGIAVQDLHALTLGAALFASSSPQSVNVATRPKNFYSSTRLRDVSAPDCRTDQES